MSLLSRFWTAAGRFAVRASPLGFLDRWLIRNHPLVWRTWIVHVAWYLGLFWVLFWLLGRYVPFTSTDPPTLATIATWNTMLLTAVVIAIALWTFAMIRHPLVGGSKTAQTMTFATIWAVLHLALSAPSAFNDALLPRIAALGDGWDFEAKDAALQPFNYGACYAGEISEQNMSIAREAAGHFEIDINGRQSNCVSDELTSLCPSETPECLVLNRAGNDLDLNALSQRMATVREAVSSRDRRTGVHANATHLSNVYTLSGSLVLSLVVAALTFRGSLPARTEAARISMDSLYRMINYAPGWVRRWDNYLLKNRPSTWAMRVHFVIISSTIVAILLIAGSSVTFQYRGRTGSFDVYLYFGCMGVGMTAAALSSSYLRRFALILDSRRIIAKALVSNFILSTPIVLLVCSMFWFSPAGISDDVFVAIFVSTMFYLLGSFSVSILAFTTRLFGFFQAFVTFVVVCISYPLWIVSSNFTDARLYFLIALWAGFSCLALLIRKMSIVSKQLTLISFCGVPWTAVCSGIASMNAIDQVAFDIYGLHPSKEQLAAIFFATSFALQILLFGYLLRPLYRILVDMHVEPKSE